MKIIIFFDQIQSGTGSKDIADTKLGLEKGAMGAVLSFQEYIHNVGAKVIVTTYCGTSYYEDNKEEVNNKMLGLLNKVEADVLLCGPCYNYHEYIKMSMSLADFVKENSKCIPIVMCSEEDKELIDKYKDKYIILKMPKKGGVGLSESFERLEKVLRLIKENGTSEEIKKLTY